MKNTQIEGMKDLAQNCMAASALGLSPRSKGRMDKALNVLTATAKGEIDLPLPFGTVTVPLDVYSDGKKNFFAVTVAPETASHTMLPGPLANRFAHFHFDGNSI